MCIKFNNFNIFDNLFFFIAPQNINTNFSIIVVTSYIMINKIVIDFMSVFGDLKLLFVTSLVR